MKTSIKLAALGAVALAATSTTALAGSTNSILPAGITTGVPLGAALPEGVYDISVASYGSQNQALGNVAYAIPVWLVWSTPWQIAGGHIMLDTATGVADAWTSTPLGGSNGVDSFLNTLVDAGIAWNLGGGWNVGLHAGAWLPSTQTLPMMVLGRDYTAFQGIAAVSYVANGWDLSATGIWAEGGDGSTYQKQNPYFNLDLTATRKYGKLELGTIAYGSWATGCAVAGSCAKADQFAIGGLVGYDFGSFIAKVKLAEDVSTSTAYGEKETRGSLMIIKPLWNPAAEGPLK